MTGLEKLCRFNGGIGVQRLVQTFLTSLTASKYPLLYSLSGANFPSISLMRQVLIRRTRRAAPDSAPSLRWRDI